MSETNSAVPELPNIVSILAEKFKGTTFSAGLYAWENIIFSLMVVGVISLVVYFACRKTNPIPNRMQNALEVVAGGLDDFICGILGHQGRKFTPFIGTLFIYIVAMNLLGIIPLMKSPTSSWSTTFALAVCVFIYVQWTAIKELGVKGYLDHLMGNPRGILAFSVVIPILMFFLHVVAELVRPLSLSLRLRSNIWGDDVLLAVLAGFGMKGLPLLFLNTLLTIIACIVQAAVFCILTTVYFALILPHDENSMQKKGII